MACCVVFYENVKTGERISFRGDFHSDCWDKAAAYERAHNCKLRIVKTDIVV